MSEAYHLAQEAMAKLRVAVHRMLKDHPDGLTNAALGRSLGIYSGHAGHEGHISRTVLALMEAEGVVHQSGENKIWRLRNPE